MGIAVKIDGDQGLLAETQNPLQLSLCIGFQNLIQLFNGCLLLQLDRQIDHRNIRSRHTNRHPVHLPFQFRDDKGKGCGCACGRGDH